MLQSGKCINEYLLFQLWELITKLIIQNTNYSSDQLPIILYNLSKNFFVGNKLTMSEVLCFESDTLKIFKNWSVNYISSKELAAAGFYYYLLTADRSKVSPST